MDKVILRYPETMMPHGRYAPNAFVTVMIALLVFIIFSLGQVIILAVYVFTSVTLRGDFNEMMIEMYNTLATHEAILTILISFAILTVITLILVRFINRQPISVMGIKSRSWLGQYALGLLIGLGLISVFMVPALLSEPIVFVGIEPVVALYLLAFVVQASAEELLFRGYLIPFLAQRIGALGSVMLSSAVFALMHIANGGQSILSMLTIFLLGALLALYTIRTGSLFGACGIHTMWNFTSGLISPIDTGGVTIDYSVVRSVAITEAPEADIVGSAEYLAYIALFMIVIAGILFVGKKRLVRRIQRDEWQVQKARRIASFALVRRFDFDGSPYFNHACAVVDRMQSVKLKTAAFLQDVCAGGKISLIGLRRRGFDEDVCQAAKVLTVAPGENWAQYLAVVNTDEIAKTVKCADIAYSIEVLHKMPPSPYTQQALQGLLYAQKMMPIAEKSYSESLN